LAWTYSAMGEKENALKYLNEVNNRSTIPSWMITFMNDWPLFDNIRNEPEFQKLKKEFEKKYQKEHDRVARLLKEEENSFCFSIKLIISLHSTRFSTYVTTFQHSLYCIPQTL
jgi:hypothetical protein